MDRFIRIRERDLPLTKPWLFETQNSREDPPDINYREIILDDQETIDYLLKADSNMHFGERCLEYQRQDVWVESEVLHEYKSWAIAMSTGSTDECRTEFFSGLQQELFIDCETVTQEWGILFHSHYERRQNEALANDPPLAPPECRCLNCWEDRLSQRASKANAVEDTDAVSSPTSDGYATACGETPSSSSHST